VRITIRRLTVRADDHVLWLDVTVSDAAPAHPQQSKQAKIINQHIAFAVHEARQDVERKF
jgi:beta-lactamase regulating signal transducer with metallopeptidase domain